MSLSSGYVIEFDRDTSSGLIEEVTTKQILPIHINNIKQRSRRYFNENNDFIGELFDFDILTIQNVNDENTFEARNVRHRVLYCHMDDCSRLKAFTNKKALDDHINIRHILKEEKRQLALSSSSSTIVVVEQPKKERRVRVKPKLISLSYDTTDAVIGRFIGKQGVNIKRFEQQHQVRIQIIDTKKQFRSIQIRIKPIAQTPFNIETITKKIEADWIRCINYQKLHEQIAAERWTMKSFTRKKNYIPSIEIENDWRSARYFNFLETKRSKRQKLIRQLKQLKSDHCYKTEKFRKDMKNQQWRVNEQLLGFA